MGEYKSVNPLKRLGGLLRLEKSNIYYIYFYAIVSGLMYLSLPLGVQAIISMIFAQKISTSLVLLILFVIMGVFLNGFMYILQMRVTERMQKRLFTLISLSYSERLPKLQLDSIEDYHLPELVNRFFDTSAIQKGVSKIILELPTASIQIIFGLMLLSFYHPVFIVFGVLLLLVLFVVLRLTAPMGISTSFEESDYKYKVGHWIEEVAHNIFSFKLRGNSDFALHKTNDLLLGYLKARSKHFKILQIQYWTFTLLKTSITAVLLITGSWLFFQNKINIGQFIAAEIVIIMTLNAVEKIITSMDGIYDLLTSLEKTSKILDKPVEEIQTIYPENFNTIDIIAHQLSFQYPNSNKGVLRDIDLKITQGEKIAIVGTRGSGKSTLLRLLTGIHTDFRGSLLINNQPILSTDLNTLRTKIGVYFTDSDIFEGTLEENLLVGNKHHTATAILQLAEKIGLTDFILSNKDALLQQLNTRGKRLSESTKAKVLLMRALLKCPRILLIDDFTYLLTKKDKSVIVDYLFANKENSYSLLIKTSDEEIMRKCDRVIFLHEGRLIADGTFEEISKTKEYQAKSDMLYELN